MKNDLSKWVEKFAHHRVLVVGDLGIDRYTEGTVDRISPEAPVPIVAVQKQRLKLGLASNVGDNVKALGGTPLLIGAVGPDADADLLRGLLRENGISDAHLLVDPSRRTCLKERIVTEQQQLLRVDYESQHPLSEDAADALMAKFELALEQADVVVMEDYAKGVVTSFTAQAMMSAAKALGKKVLVDPNTKSPISHYRGAYCLTPNRKEAEALAGIPIRDEESLVSAARAILEKTQSATLIITRGRNGMAVFGEDFKKTGRWTRLPTAAREVYDVSGAGDTVIATLALALSAGAKLEDAAMLGNLAAGVEVSKRGTATVSPSELLNAIHHSEF